MFKPGDKVVCVDDVPRNSGHPLFIWRFSFPSGFVKSGIVYCVDAAFEGDNCDRVEISGYPVFDDGESIGWQADRFRLVHRCKDSVNASVSNEVEA